MGFGLLIAGFMFLLNPVIHVVDILPDAVGFFLIFAGLTKMSYIVGKIQLSRDWFFKLAFLEVIKFFSIIFVPYTSGSALVLMTFVFGLAEIFLFVNAVNQLFEGISFAGLWYSGSSMYGNIAVRRTGIVKKTDGRKGIGRVTRNVERIAFIKRTVLGFYIFRVLATFVPEMTELQMYDNIGEVKAIGYRLTYYKPFLYVVFSIAVVIYAIVFAVRVCRYFGNIRNDGKFITSLTEKYERDILPKESFFTAIGMKRVLILFTFAVVTSFILPVDGVNICVGAISSILLIVAAVILRKYVKFAVLVIPAAAVRIVMSVVNFVLQIGYFREYTVEAVEWIEKAYNQYYTMTGVACVEYVIALASVIVFLTALMKAIKKHLEGFGVETESAQYSKRNRDLEIYNAVGGKLLLCSILAILHYSFACAFHYLLPSMDVISVIVMVVTLIYAAYAVYTVNFIGSMVYDKEIELN